MPRFMCITGMVIEFGGNGHVSAERPTLGSKI